MNCIPYSPDTPQSSNRRQVGAMYESAAESFLIRQGLTILARNFRCKAGEIDLVAQELDYLVFVEVRYRKNRRGGGALASVGSRKQRRICLAASFYLLSHCGTLSVPCRFDVIGIDADQVQWVKDAFPYHI